MSGFVASPAPPPGQLAANLTRDVSIADGRDLATGAIAAAGIVPARPTAIICNFAVTNTTGGGYLTVNPGGNNIVAASTISWFGSGQVLANGVAVPVSNDLKVTVIAGGGGQTDFVLDVTG